MDVDERQMQVIPGKNNTAVVQKTFEGDELEIDSDSGVSDTIVNSDAETVNYNNDNDLPTLEDFPDTSNFPLPAVKVVPSPVHPVQKFREFFKTNKDKLPKLPEDPAPGFPAKHPRHRLIHNHNKISVTKTSVKSEF